MQGGLKVQPSPNGLRMPLRKVAPLIDLLNKDEKREWMGYCQEAFQKLKHAVAVELMLRLPDIEKPFEVNTNALDETIGGNLAWVGPRCLLESEA